MNVKIKKLHKDAVIPSYAKPGDAGMDLTAVNISFDEFDNLVCETGLAVEIPKGYVGLVFPRSSISKYALHLRNSVGVIDSGYRGEILIKFGYVPNELVYKKGEKVAQLVIIPYPEVSFEEVDELSETERGDGGFGSTTQQAYESSTNDDGKQ
jgi:dUTP pyrophosphatase